MRLLRVGTAAVGILPTILASYFANISMLVAFLLQTVSALMVASAATATESVISKTVYTIDVCAACGLTIVCGLNLNAHGSLVGMLRLLWLVALVAALSAVSNFTQLLPKFARGPIPDDMTLIACGATVLLLVGTRCLQACRRDAANGARAARDKRAMVVELVLAAGAMSRRFEAQIDALLKIDLGNSFWYASSWCAGCGVLYILRHPSSGDAETERVVARPTEAIRMRV